MSPVRASTLLHRSATLRAVSFAAALGLVTTMGLGAGIAGATDRAPLTMAVATPTSGADGGAADAVGSGPDTSLGQTSGRSLPLGPGEARYIVRTSGTSALDRVQSRLAGLGVRQLDRWEHALTGLLVQATPQRAAALANVPGVVSVDRTVPVSTQDVQYSPTNWGLDRVDQRTALDPALKAYGSPSDGAGVTAYVIDTGVRMTHTEFTGRLDPAESFYYPFPASSSCAAATSANDAQGHGTHVAGILAGTTYGVAKGAQVVPVRVLDCKGSGEDATVISGINWVIAHHAAGTPAVANMSLGGPASPALDAAVTALQADGITVVVAAGNQDSDTCERSPSRVTSLIAVSAVDRSDRAAAFSNFGPCNDLFAPGYDIRSAWYTSDSAYDWSSGTSMASPFVAGAAALLLGRSPSMTPAQVWAALDASSTKGVVAEKTGDPDKLLYVEQFVAVPPWSDQFEQFDLPLRLLDTRPGARGVWEAVDQSTRLAAGEVRRYSTARMIPANASLVLNIVAVDGLAAGHIRLYPCASTTTTKPVVSFLNYNAASTVSNEGIVGVGSAGGVCVFAQSSVHLVIDVVGWFPQGTTLTPLATPVRLFDTRVTSTGTNNRGVLEASVDEASRFAAGEVRRYSPLGVSGSQLPASGVAALAVNVTAVLPATGGELAVYPCDAVSDVPEWTTTSVAYPSSRTVAVGAVVTLSTSGSFCVRSSGVTDVLVDVAARFGAGAGFGTFASPGRPVRLLDTREGAAGAAEPTDVTLPLAGATSGATMFVFPGTAALPSSPRPSALVLTVTVRAPTARGFLKMWACGGVSSQAPVSSVLNFSLGVDTANLVVVPLSVDNGGLCVRASATTHVTVDVASWFVSVPA